MKQKAYQLAHALKNLKSSDGNDRLQCAVILAQHLAFTQCVNNYTTSEQACEATEPTVRKIIDEVTEHVPVDTRLTLATYREFMAIRFELIYGIKDSALLKVVLSSDAAVERLDGRTLNMAQHVTSSMHDASAHADIVELLKALCAEV